MRKGYKQERGPSKASLREIPEADFSKGTWRRNPLAARIAKEGYLLPDGRHVMPQARRGRPKKGEERPPKEPTRLERQVEQTWQEAMEELPKQCDWGTKKDSNGKKHTWKGFKLHWDVADNGIPLAAVLTAASPHDSQVAIPLAKMTAERVVYLYDLMDAAYDAKAIAEFCRSQGRVPIIDKNSRGHDVVPMDPATARRYDERTTVERANSGLKDDFGGRMVRVRGPAKVFAHLMFGILALTADRLLHLAA